MPSTDDLHAAGARAANRPAPLPPTIESLTAEVARRRSRRRRVVGSSIAALALVVAIPVAASQFGADDTEPSLLTAAQETAVDESSPDDSIDTPPADDPAPVEDDDKRDDDKHDDDRYHDDHDFKLQLGDDLAFEIHTVGGPEATEAADAAAAAAEETREVDGIDVWIERNDDTTTVSALVEPELFVKVTGPSESIDGLLDIVTMKRDFDLPFGPGFDSERLDEFLPPGLLDDLLEREKELRERFESGEGFPPFDDDELERFFDEEFEGFGEGFLFENEDFRFFFENSPFKELEECFAWDLEESESETSLTIPECPLFGDDFFSDGWPFGDHDAEETSVST